jgi:hypothetical protein
MSLKKVDKFLKLKQFNKATKEIYAYLDNQKEGLKHGTKTKERGIRPL